MNKKDLSLPILRWMVMLACSIMLAGVCMITARAETAGTDGYVLMNIPYEKFYQAELAEGSAKVDAVTSATKNKPRTGTLAGGSYHVDPEGTDISGVIYPVYVSDMTALFQYKQITDEDSVDITVTNRGKESTTTYKGKDALFESADYSYYVLSEKPAFYKEFNTDGSFSAVKGEARTVSGVEGTVTAGARHADVEISLSGTEGIAQGDTVSAVIVTDSDGKTYGLRHVTNIWRATEIGWNLSDMDLGGENHKKYPLYYPAGDLRLSCIPCHSQEWLCSDEHSL